VVHDPGSLADAPIPQLDDQPLPNHPLVDRDLHPTIEDATLDDLKISLAFINLIRSATLDNGGLDPDTIHRLRNPKQGPPDVDDPDLILAIKIYLATTKASQDTYTEVGQAISERFEECEFLSMDCLKRKIAAITGIVPMVHNMCINSCVGYTGPFADLTHCPTCGTSHYDPLKFNASNGEIRIPQQTFCTIPLGPQI